MRNLYDRAKRLGGKPSGALEQGSVSKEPDARDGRLVPVQATPAIAVRYTSDTVAEMYLDGWWE